MKQSGRERHDNTLKTNIMDTVFVKVLISERLPPKVSDLFAKSKGWGIPSNWSDDVVVSVSMTDLNGLPQEALMVLYREYGSGSDEWLTPKGDRAPSTISQYNWWLEEITLEEAIQRELEEQNKVELV